MADRLRLPVIEPKPKEVELLQPFARRIAISSDQQAFLLRIIKAIEQGVPLPPGSYRVSPHRDILLETLGIMHLHLGHPGSEELLYLVQYPEHVVLIELGTHEHFLHPIGSRLEKDYGTRLTLMRTKRRNAVFLKRQRAAQAPRKPGS